MTKEQERTSAMSRIADIFRKIPEEEGDQIFEDPYRFFAIAEDFAGGNGCGRPESVILPFKIRHPFSDWPGFTGKQTLSEDRI